MKNTRSFDTGIPSLAPILVRTPNHSLSILCRRLLSIFLIFLKFKDNEIHLFNLQLNSRVILGDFSPSSMVQNDWLILQNGSGIGAASPRQFPTVSKIWQLSFWTKWGILFKKICKLDDVIKISQFTFCNSYFVLRFFNPIFAPLSEKGIAWNPRTVPATVNHEKSEVRRRKTQVKFSTNNPLRKARRSWKVKVRRPCWKLTLN